jgi:hypothetical protein
MSASLHKLQRFHICSLVPVPQEYTPNCSEYLFFSVQNTHTHTHIYIYIYIYVHTVAYPGNATRKQWVLGLIDRFYWVLCLQVQLQRLSSPAWVLCLLIPRLFWVRFLLSRNLISS